MLSRYHGACVHISDDYFSLSRFRKTSVDQRLFHCGLHQGVKVKRTLTILRVHICRCAQLVDGFLAETRGQRRDHHEFIVMSSVVYRMVERHFNVSLRLNRCVQHALCRRAYLVRMLQQLRGHYVSLIILSANV